LKKKREMVETLQRTFFFIFRGLLKAAVPVRHMLRLLRAPSASPRVQAVLQTWHWHRDRGLFHPDMMSTKKPPFRSLRPRSVFNEWRRRFTPNPHQHPTRLWTRLLLATHGAFYSRTTMCWLRHRVRE
jgi:hypothetical protein